MGSKPSKPTSYYLSLAICNMITKYLGTLLIENITIYESDSKLKRMVVNRSRENIKSIVDVNFTMSVESPFDDVVKGTDGNISLGSVMKNFFISELTEWFKLNPDGYFILTADKFALAHTADRLARAFIKHMFNGIDAVFGPDDLIIDKKELATFINELNYAHTSSYKCVLLRKLIVSKLDTFDISSCMNEKAPISNPSVSDKDTVYGSTEE